MINNLTDLAKHVGAAHPSGESVGRRLFRDTECGVVFKAMPTRVLVGGYAEGSEAELPLRTLEYPFTPEEFDRVLAAADADGCDEWDAVNGPTCETCDGQGVLYNNNGDIHGVNTTEEDCPDCTKGLT